MSKREVWVVEHDTGELAEWKEGPLAYLDAECSGERKKLLAASPGNRIARYVPEPPEVEGWPTRAGWYWLKRPDRAYLEVVEVIRRREKWTALVSKTWPHEIEGLREEDGPGFRFFGPIEPPSL